MNLIDSRNILPSRLYIEPTTFCNLSCDMCVKQAPGNELVEGNLSPQILDKLTPVFKHLESVIFSGIGEPLLHPNLEDLVSSTRNLLPQESRIGIQSNGFLLYKNRIDSLLAAGLDTICLSLDSISSDFFKQMRSGGELESIQTAFAYFNGKIHCNPQFQFGVEFVLMKQNMHELPSVIQWAADNGASFAIVTHVLPYRRELEAETVNSPNLNISRELYSTYKSACKDQNLDLDEYLRNRWKYHFKKHKSINEQALADLGKQMIEEAYGNNIPLHLKNLMSEDDSILLETEALFKEAQKIAARTGLKLILPELFPKNDRQCHFVEEGSLFVSWDGKVYPCYFLWHHYTFYQNGHPLKVTDYPLGDLNQHGIDEIWNNQQAVLFREQVLEYKYPYCGNCSLGPCSLFTAKPFEYDCYTIEVPCGICPWCGGLLHCLR